MSLVKLDRESEPYSRYGNISADGIQKLLGTPNEDRLDTVIRETVQNSWDARVEGTTPEYRIEIRKLKESERRVFLENVFVDLPEEPEKKHALESALGSDGALVLEISDFGTSGLGGPTRPDEPSGNGEPPDFVDFIRNIGTPRDTEYGGGTYGYGKSSLYALSTCQTILIHTVTRCMGEPVRRLMAARVAHRYDVNKGSEKGRYTGRHWWGVREGNEHLDPLTGDDAGNLASAMGLVPRTMEDFGTTIMVLLPDLPKMAVSQIAASMVQTLLWNFWPKMLPHKKTEQQMKFSVYLNGAAFPIPKVEDCPPLDLFASAMTKLKNGESTVHSIDVKRPKKHLGMMSIEKGLRSERNKLFSGEDSVVPNLCSHVALMRPAELVIKYMQGQPLPTESYEWAGVFVCDDDDEVERAFAASEPPAHDDWIPNYLSDARHKTYVNVALREIRRLMKDYSGPRLPTAGDADSPSLGQVGDELGGLLLGAAGQGVGGVKPRPGSTKRKPVKLGTPRFIRLEQSSHAVCAVFEIRLTGPKNRKVTIMGRPAIVTDGGGSDSETPDGEHPEIVEWFDQEGTTMGSGTVLETTCETEKIIGARVSMPGHVAVSLTARLGD